MHYLNHHRAMRKAMEGRKIRDVQRKSGIPESTLLWLRKGRRDLKLSQLFKLWKAMGYDVSVWLTPKDKELPAFILNDVGLEDKSEPEGSGQTGGSVKGGPRRTGR